MAQLSVLVVGSFALRRHLGDFRSPRDLDLIAEEPQAHHVIKALKVETVIPDSTGSKLVCLREGKLPVEIILAWPGTTAERVLKLEAKANDRFWFQSIDGQAHWAPVASLNTLYLLKMSHRFRKNSPHFKKCMEDIKVLRGLGAVIEDPQLLKDREKETYTNTSPKLTVGKSTFFDPTQVEYRYDHDSIHLAMARGADGRPAYESFKGDLAEVMVDREKWLALDYDTQLNSVIEEACVLALERSQIPFRGKVDPRRSFEIALEKVCTSISSGWWREFAWENYDNAWARYNPHYVRQFDEALASGIVRPFVPPTVG